MKNLLIFVFLQSFSALCQGQTIDYSCAIPLQVNDLGWKNVPLPLSVLEQSYADLSDVRIYGKTAAGDTIEVPYLHKIALQEIKTVDANFTLINQSSLGKSHYFTFSLKNRQEINQIKLNFEDANFDWDVNLQGGNDNKTWFDILKDYRIFAFSNGSEDYQFTGLKFPNSDYNYYRIELKTKEKPRFRNASLQYTTRTTGAYLEKTLYTNDYKSTTKDKKQKFTFDVSGLYPFSELQFFVGNTFDYFRPVFLSHSIEPKKSDREKSPISGARTLANGHFSSLEPSIFFFSPSIVSKINLEIDNKDNPSLQIDSVLVRSPKQFLVANFTEKAEYFLAFDANNTRSPQYDIHHFLDKIPMELDEIGLGDMVKTEDANATESNPLFGNKSWIWGLMALIIGVLGWFSLKMLQEK